MLADTARTSCAWEKYKAGAMEAIDSDASESGSEQSQKPSVDVDAVNAMLTEVHQQYNNLLLKYSSALNVIDDLRCQLACGVSHVNISKPYRKHSNAVLRAGICAHERSLEVQKAELSASKQQLTMLMLQQSGARFIRATSVSTSTLGNRVEAKTPRLALQTSEASFLATEEHETSCASEENDELDTLAESSSSCAKPGYEEEHVSLIEADPQDSRRMVLASCVDERGGPSSHKKTRAAALPKHHQVAVVYPAQRTAQLCTMGCCLAHSCYCCQHVKHLKNPAHGTEPTSCCFTTGSTASPAPLSQKCLCSCARTSSDASLTKVSSALDVALKLAGELQRSSCSLLEQL